MAAEIQVYQNVILNYFTAIYGIYETEITFRSGLHPQDISVPKYKLLLLFLKIAGCCGSVAEHFSSMQENLALIPSLKKKTTYTYIKNLLSLRKNITYQIKQKFKSKVHCSLAYYITNTQLTLALLIFHTCLIGTLNVS